MTSPQFSADVPHDQRIAMPASIDLFPAELLLAIIECFVTPTHFDLVGRTIFFFDEEILPLSQVNRHFRHLCLPQLYRHIIIVVTREGVSQSRARNFELFRRIMEQKPHFAKLVRSISMYNLDPIFETYQLGSFTFLPNLSNIKFPDLFEPYPHLLSEIASHPPLSIAQWRTLGLRETPFRLLLSSTDALPRIHINYFMVTVEENRVYSCTSHISVHTVSFQHNGSPKELSYTFSNLSQVRVDVRDSPSPRPLWWFPAFMERHPQVTRIQAGFWHCKPSLSWRALRDIALFTPLYNAADRQRLLSSFSFFTFIAERQAVDDDQFALSRADIVLRSSALDVIRFVGSSMPVSHTLNLSFMVEEDSPPIFVDDLLSAIHQSLPNQTCLLLYGIAKILPAFRRHDLHARRDGTAMVQYMGLARLLASGMPKLGRIAFSEEFGRAWGFSVRRDEQGEVQIVHDDD